MASRTQLRLQQLTGSAIDIRTEAQQYVTPSEADALTGSDVQDLFGMLGAALLRIHGAASDEPFNSAEGTFATSVFDVNATGAVTVDSSGGTISIGADNVNQNINIGTDGVREITIGDASAANAAGLTLRANTGGIDIDCSRDTGALSLDTAGGAIEIGVNAAAGAINIGTNATQRKITIGSATGNTELEIATGTGGVDVDSTGKINIATSNANADAIILDASAAGGGIDIIAGNAANDANSDISIIASNKLTIDAQGTDADDGVEITLGDDTSSVKFVVQNNSGNDALVVDGLLDVTIGRDLTVAEDLTVAGDLIVQGSTTTISSSNTVFQDSIIGLGVSGSTNEDWNNAGDRAIIFARAAESYSFLPAINYDGSNSEFEFGTFSASPSSSSMGNAQAGVNIRAGNVKPITSNTHTLGDADEMWADLFLGNGAVVNFNNGNFRLTHSANALTIDTDDKLQFRDANAFIHSNDANDLTVSATDITLDAGASIALSFDGGPGTSVKIQDGTTLIGILSGTLEGDTKGFVLSSSLGGSLDLDSSSGNILFSNVGTAVAVIGAEADAATFGAANDSDLKFVHDQMAQNPVEVVRIDASTSAFAFPQNDATGSKEDSNAQRLGILSFNGTNDLDEAIYGDGARLYLRSNGVNFKFPTAGGSANEVLVTDGDSSNPTLSFSSLSSLTAPTKAIKILTAGVNAGQDVQFNSVDAGTAITDFALTEAQGATLDVFVNGQLLVSGSVAQRTSGDRDYNVKNVNTLNFAFSLEVDDVIQVIKR